VNREVGGLGAEKPTHRWLLTFEQLAQLTAEPIFFIAASTCVLAAYFHYSIVPAKSQEKIAKKNFLFFFLKPLDKS
jgi:hypothetical protein